MGNKLEDIARIVGGEVVGDLETPPCGVVVSGNHAKAGSLFVAVRGAVHDGHSFLEDAFLCGSVAAVVEDRGVLKGRPGVVVADTRGALSVLADYFSDSPTRYIPVIGVTGTNGKTTSHWMVAQLLEAAGQLPLRIGTIGAFATGCIDNPGVLTTPDPISLHELFRNAFTKKCSHAVMEVSSHALEQKRVEDVRFDVGVFTNLTRDHLDYHHTMERYGDAKKHLFSLIGKNGKGPKGAVINIDDPFGLAFAEHARRVGCRVVTFGESEGADYRLSSFTQTVEGSTFTLLAPEENVVPVHSSFIGRYNASNLTAALISVSLCGCPIDLLSELAPTLAQVPGRLEAVGQNGIGVYVDYAHTPDALQSALSALRDLTTGKLWVVFGCGGDRDRGKRPQMAAVAAIGADKVVVTSDNPRTEDPQMIIADILSEGIEATIIEVDRRRAIMQTLECAERGDVVLIAGKGHETYQILGTTKIHFSDAEVVRDFFSRGTQ